MKKLDGLKIGQCIPASFVVNGKEFNNAYPLPYSEVVISDDMLQLKKPCEISIPLHHVRTITFDVRKRFDGFLHWSILSLVHFTVVNGEVYTFENSSMLLIPAIYNVLKDSTIQFVDEYDLIHLLSDINTDQTTLEIEKDIVNAVTPLSEKIPFITERTV